VLQLQINTPTQLPINPLFLPREVKVAKHILFTETLWYTFLSQIFRAKNGNTLQLMQHQYIMKYFCGHFEEKYQKYELKFERWQEISPLRWALRYAEAEQKGY